MYAIPPGEGRADAPRIRDSEFGWRGGWGDAKTPPGAARSARLATLP